MTAPHSEAAASTAANPGETLRAAREEKGLPLSSVAQQLNLSERSLAQIEAGDFSRMPGLTFARGYVRAYAKLLELDQNRLVNEFDHHTGTGAAASNINSLGNIDEPVRLSRSVMRFFVFALILIVAAAALFWWQDQTTRGQSVPALSSLDQIEVEAADGTTEIHLFERDEELPEPGPDEPRDTPLAETLSSPGQPEQAPVEQSTGESVATSEAPVAVQPVTEPVTPTPTPASAAEAVAPAPGEGRLTLTFTDDCWTRVTDANGEVLYSALAKAGSSRTLVGKTPLDLHLGFPAGAQVSFNGEAVNLSGITRGETARLKLGQ
ncbi:RodZ domain-containing protein [Stutzerimonas stutzeri]|uniref:RodZ domain-containing protein n=1 Tax=Stutzerimonas stutzeri TaxID=316 RepID=UPI00210913EB|nr:RodZ family helix-turn-helix domain-containing protein [Stutzerimonas stutzeri]MCQ4242968.1 helix-turn-helix domain-containing protein [Stutzerimonas stutzeri]